MRPIMVFSIFVFLFAFLPAGVGAQNLFTCDDFAMQGEAQAVYDADPGDPNQLDPDNDGIACENLPSSTVRLPTANNEDNDSGTLSALDQILRPNQAPTVSAGGTGDGDAAEESPANLTCTDFDAWEWSQSLFESDPEQYTALDADGDGEACPELPRGGFAPAFWTDQIPDDTQEVELVRIIDGDTFEVLIDGVSNRVRIYRADTPETQNEQHCGGEEATAFVEFALSLNDAPGTVYLERDANERDRFGRELAYIWFEIGGLPYMLNHALINNGWAEDVDYGDLLYDEQLNDAEGFAQEHQLGVYELCGAFGMALNDTQSQPVEPAVPVALGPPSSAGCDPNYTPCIPVYPPDLDCGEIGITVTVVGGDPHGLDREGDGLGCE